MIRARRRAAPVEDVELRGVGRGRGRRPRCSTRSRPRARIVIGPSNPVISIGPILAVPGMREALRDAPGARRRGLPDRRRRGAQGPDRGFLRLGRPRRRRRGRRRAATTALLDGLVADERADARCRSCVTDTLMSDARAAGASPARRSTSPRASPMARAASHVAVLPVKRFDAREAAPGRAIWRPARGARSPRRWSADVLDGAARAAAVDERLVVTPSRRPPMRRRAARRRRRLDDAEAGPERGRGCSASRARSSSAPARVLLVPGDTPGARPAPSRRAARAPADERASSIVPDRHGTGTNALLLDAARRRSPPPSAPAAASATRALAARGRRATVRGRRARRRSRSTSTRPTTSRRCAALADRRGGARTRADAQPLAGRERRRDSDRLAITAAALAACPRSRRRRPRARCCAARRPARDGDVLVVAHKVVSKAEGRVVALDDVVPSERARGARRRARQGPARTCRSSSTRPPSSCAPSAAC